MAINLQGCSQRMSVVVFQKKYSRRNLVWQKIVDLCRLGHTHLIAIDKVYENYGCDCTVTQIMNKISVENRQNRRAADATINV